MPPTYPTAATRFHVEQLSPLCHGTVTKVSPRNPRFHDTTMTPHHVESPPCPGDASQTTSGKPPTRQAESKDTRGPNSSGPRKKPPHPPAAPTTTNRGNAATPTADAEPPPNSSPQIRSPPVGPSTSTKECRWRPSVSEDSSRTRTWWGSRGAPYKSKSARTAGKIQRFGWGGRIRESPVPRTTTAQRPTRNSPRA